MTVPDTSLQTPQWRRLALVAYMFLTTAAFGFLQPFVPLYLAAAGLRAGKIGIVLGIGTGTVLLVQPLLGRLSDFLDARRPLLIGAALIAGAAYAAYTVAPQGSLWAFLLLTCLGRERNPVSQCRRRCFGGADCRQPKRGRGSVCGLPGVGIGRLYHGRAVDGAAGSAGRWEFIPGRVWIGLFSARSSRMASGCSWRWR